MTVTQLHKDCFVFIIFPHGQCKFDNFTISQLRILMKTLSQFTIKGECFCNSLAQNKHVNAKRKALFVKHKSLLLENDLWRLLIT